jgi:DNA polymerase-3 subunit beta
VGLAELSEPLHAVAGALDRKQSEPILSHLLFQVSERSLTLLTNDQTLQISSSCELNGGSETCMFTVPGRKFMDICRYMPEQASLDFDVKDNAVILACGQFRSQLMSLPADEFPQTTIDNTEIHFSLEADLFRRSLDQVAFAMASQDVRYFFNGLLLEVRDNDVYLVATNGQRLAMTSFAVDAGTGDHQAILPRKTVLEIYKLLKSEGGEVLVSVNQQQLAFEVGSKKLITQLIDATYPDYRKAIPTDNHTVLLVDRGALKAALVRISICSNELYKNVKMSLGSGVLTLSANNSQLEEAIEDLPVDYQGESLEIGFNVSYLTDVLSAMNGTQVEFRLAGSSEPMLITDPAQSSAQYVISPMVM